MSFFHFRLQTTNKVKDLLREAEAKAKTNTYWTSLWLSAFQEFKSHLVGYLPALSAEMLL